MWYYETAITTENIGLMSITNTHVNITVLAQQLHVVTLIRFQAIMQFIVILT